MFRDVAILGGFFVSPLLLQEQSEKGFASISYMASLKTANFNYLSSGFRRPKAW